MNIPLTERVQRLTSWFHRENDRPLLGFYLSSQYPLHRYPGSTKSILNGIVRPEDVVVDDYLDDCDRLYDLYEDTGGDLIWSAAPFFGLPWVEASLGCTVMADHSAGSIRSEPPLGFAENPAVPEFSVRNPWVAKMLESIPSLEERSQGRYPVGVTLMRGISDLLSALYGGTEFIMRMHEAPDEVASLAERLADYWIEFGRCLMKHVPLFHGGTGSFFYSVWCPGKTIWMQEDAAALLSPELYEKFIYPHNCRVADAFEHTVMHLHPSRFMPVDYLIKSKIDVVEIHIDKGGPSAEELYYTHMKVLSEKPLIIWGDLTERDLDFILEHVLHQGLAINTVVSGEEQAEAYWNRLKRNINIQSLI